jgi:hypothetical protein
MSGKYIHLGWMEGLQAVQPRGGACALETNMAVTPHQWKQCVVWCMEVSSITTQHDGAPPRCVLIVREFATITDAAVMGLCHEPRIPRTWRLQTFSCGGTSSQLCTKMKLIYDRRSPRPLQRSLRATWRNWSARYEICRVRRADHVQC